MRITGLFLCAFFVLFSWRAEAGERVKSFSVKGDVFFSHYNSYRSSNVVELKNATPGSLPILRYQYREMGPSHVEHGPERSLIGSQGEAGRYSKIEFPAARGTLIVHARWPSRSGDADLWINGQFYERISFGGTSVSFSGKRFRNIREIDVTHSAGGAEGISSFLIKGGSTAPVVASVSYQGGRLDTNHHEVDWTGGQTATLLVGARSAPESTESRNVTVVLSRIAGDIDSDGDGLVDDVEHELGTCMSGGFGVVNRFGFDCMQVNAADSDQDGISDYQEVFGVDGESVEGAAQGERLPFRLWGADPAQKDIFVAPVTLFREGDTWAEHSEYLSLSPEELLKNEVENWVSGNNISNFLGYHTEFYRDPSGVLKNPNGADWVRFHFDFPMYESATTTVSTPATLSREEYVSLVFRSDSNRRHFEQSSLECSEFVSGEESTVLQRRFFFVPCYNRRHGGIALRHLAYIADFRSTAPAHELGHVLGLGHGGANDNNRKPNYLSEMNYKYDYKGYQYGFSDGANPVLNAANLCEEEYVPDNLAEALRGEREIVTRTECLPDGCVDRQYIDWNENGVLDCGVRAPIQEMVEGENLPGQPEAPDPIIDEELRLPSVAATTGCVFSGVSDVDGVVWVWPYEYECGERGNCRWSEREVFSMPSTVDVEHFHFTSDGGEYMYMSSVVGDDIVVEKFAIVNEDRCGLEFVGKTRVVEAMAHGRASSVWVDGAVYLGWVDRNDWAWIAEVDEQSIDHGRSVGRLKYVFNGSHVRLFSLTASLYPYENESGRLRMFGVTLRGDFIPTRTRDRDVSYFALDWDFSVINLPGFYPSKGERSFSTAWVESRSDSEERDGRWMVVYPDDNRYAKVIRFRDLDDLSFRDPDREKKYKSWNWGHADKMRKNIDGSSAFDVFQSPKTKHVFGVSTKITKHGEYKLRTYFHADGIVDVELRDFNDLSIIRICRAFQRKWGGRNCVD